MSKSLGDAEARAIALKLAARARYDGMTVTESESTAEVAGIVDVVVTVKVAWQCPACKAQWVKRGHPGYGELRSCAACHSRFFLRRPTGL